jgi:hypothetical protein
MRNGFGDVSKNNKPGEYSLGLKLSYMSAGVVYPKKKKPNGV